MQNNLSSLSFIGSLSRSDERCLDKVHRLNTEVVLGLLHGASSKLKATDVTPETHAE